MSDTMLAVIISCFMPSADDKSGMKDQRRRTTLQKEFFSRGQRENLRAHSGKFCSGILRQRQAVAAPWRQQQRFASFRKCFFFSNTQNEKDFGAEQSVTTRELDTV